MQRASHASLAALLVLAGACGAEETWDVTPDAAPPLTGTGDGGPGSDAVAEIAGGPAPLTLSAP